MVRAEPKTVTAGPTAAIASKPSTNSERIRRARHVSVSWKLGALALEELLVLGRRVLAAHAVLRLGRDPHAARAARAVGIGLVGHPG